MTHKESSPITRREALCRMGSGFGMMAFAGIVGESLARAQNVSSAQSAKWPKGGVHHAARAKHVIFLYMNGGLSQVDSFDPKPMLDKYHGQPLPGGTILTERKTGALLRSPYTFKKYGQCGMEVSELFPQVGECADSICWIRSLCTDIPNHEPSMLMMNTGFSQAGRPSLGSWLTYGLGVENKNLPGFVVLCPDVPTTVGPPLWNSSFLPAIHQGTYISDRPGEKQNAELLVEPGFDPQKLISYIHNQKFALPEQRRELDLLTRLNRLQMEREKSPDPQLEATIESMETAYRMQTEAPEVFDIRKETPATLKLYGPGSTARGCLLAVRLVQRGVRMVQVYYAKGDPWDAHIDIQAHRKCAIDSDQPFAAVIKDLKSRGLLDDTLVVCGSEFGRTPVVEMGGNGIQNGRDHNPFAFTMWMAGGGVKGGHIYGATDDFGFKVVDKPVHVHDLHATILHLLGIDHTKLTYHYSGRDFRLTDVAGNVIHDLIA
jgi:uncharacterized protein DUF1501